MIPEGYVQALVDYATAIDSVTPLETERDALFGKLQSGGREGKVLINGDINNKQFGWQVSMTVEEKFQAFVQAVKLFNGAVVPMTYGIFPWLVR